MGQTSTSATTSATTTGTPIVGNAGSPSPYPIVATVVPDGLRLRFLPKHFGASMMRAEAAVYDSMGAICCSYHGGFWNFIELSNGGCYLQLQGEGTLPISVSMGNDFSGELSHDAASITATLFALNRLIQQGLERFDGAYYRLLDFAAQHPERADIFMAID